MGGHDSVHAAQIPPHGAEFRAPMPAVPRAALMAGLLTGCPKIAVLILMSGWRRATGGPRERLGRSGGSRRGPGGLAMIALIVAVGPWLSYVVVPLFMLAFGPYLARLPESQSTIGHINWRRTGKLWIIMGILLLVLDAWVLLARGRT